MNVVVSSTLVVSVVVSVAASDVVLNVVTSGLVMWLRLAFYPLHSAQE